MLCYHLHGKVSSYKSVQVLCQKWLIIQTSHFRIFSLMLFITLDAINLTEENYNYYLLQESKRQLRRSKP